MTHKWAMKLLSPKAFVKIGKRNVRTMFETGNCAQVIKEMQRYGISILRISEMRWNWEVWDSYRRNCAVLRTG